MQTFYENILRHIGEDLNREGLKDTPKRAAKAFLEITQGYNLNLTEIINGAIFKSYLSEMVIVKDIELYSLCEHHLLPFIGKCHVAYIPNGQIIGLSKIPRIVDMFAKRLQVQEHLTKQIGDSLMKAIDAKGVGVIIEAQHLCMMMRGVKKQNATMKTSYMVGSFLKSAKTRQEFLNLIQ